MDKSGSNQLSGGQAIQVIPMVRGLLARSTGDPDIPWEPVILRLLAGREGVDFAADEANAKRAHYPKPLVRGPRPPLFVTVPDQDAGPDGRRHQMEEKIARFAAQHDGKPDIVCLRDLGVLYIDRGQEGVDLPLRNKVALVTGTAGAIGYGICRGLLEQGGHVAATDLAGEKLDRFVADLGPTAPGRMIGVPLDVTSQESVAAGFETVIRTWGGIDIVIISTKNVPSPGAGFGAYSATKAACHQLGRIASIELAPHGIRVNMVAPDGVFSEGKFKSGLWEEVGPDRMRARGLDEQGLQEYYRNRNLLKARVTGQHVANAVLFFVTRQTPTTGATIPVDGGLPDATPR